MSGLHWTTEKLGMGISLNSERDTVSRNTRSGWGVQLADVWLSARGNDAASVVLACEAIGEQAYFGVVGRNYFPGDWDTPLNESHHAVVVDASHGRSYLKQEKGSLLLQPLVSGSRIKLEVNMQLRELRVSLLNSMPSTEDTVDFEIALDYLPPEVTLAVCFGPGENRVRIESSDVERTNKHPANKQRKDLWDEDNKVEPMTLQGPLVESAQAKVNRNSSNIAELLE